MTHNTPKKPRNKKGFKTLFIEKQFQTIRRMLTLSEKKPSTTLDVKFRQEENQCGWIEIDIETELAFTTIIASSAFDPFDEFVWWMEGVLNDFLPIRWEVEEEGSYKICFVFAVDSENLRLVILADDEYVTTRHRFWSEASIMIDTIIPKEVFVKRFYLAFKKFVQHEYIHERWDDSDLREHLERLDARCGRYWGGIHPSS